MADPIVSSSTAARQTGRQTLLAMVRYLNNRIEQDHRRIKRRVRFMLDFKSQACAATILSRIELVQMMRKRQARYAVLFDRDLRPVNPVRPAGRPADC
jgi:transposase-like protein